MNAETLNPRKPTMTTITYYADNGSMGDTSDQHCDKYREWAEQELKREYPTHVIEVTQEQATVTAYTDDLDNEKEIIDFCSRLWDNCSWDWM